jgi:hypothetical protein
LSSFFLCLPNKFNFEGKLDLLQVKPGTTAKSFKKLLLKKRRLVALLYQDCTENCAPLPCFLCIEDFVSCLSSASNLLETGRFLNVGISLPTDII